VRIFGRGKDKGKLSVMEVTMQRNKPVLPPHAGAPIGENGVDPLPADTPHDGAATNSDEGIRIVVEFARSFRQLGVIIVSFVIAAALLIGAFWLRADGRFDDPAFIAVLVLAGIIILSAHGLTLFNAKTIATQSALATRASIDTLSAGEGETSRT
jgi:hypothetical protein